MGKKTDYDLAVKILSLVGDLKNLMDDIIDNLYTFRIQEQPTDQNVATSGDTVTFTVIATGVKSYEWQYRTGDSGSSPGPWRAIFSAATGADTNSVSFPSNSTRAAYGYRCKMTDYDNVAHFTNKVNFTIGS